MSLPLNQVICGDCVEVLAGFPDKSIDLVVTDPPYGLSFMGKDWDKTLPPKEAFEQVIRVLKPGALAFVMSSPRQDLMARMILLLEDAGFKTDVSFIEWIYKTGFPKAYDVSKGIDKKLGVLEERKIIGYKLLNPRDKKPYPQNADIGYHGNILGGLQEITEPVANEAKRWEGWKAISGLKPAQEPILMAYKPLSERTIVDNVLRWGTGAINVDACRIPFDEKGITSGGDNWTNVERKAYGEFDADGKHYRAPVNLQGRFPANLLVSDKAIDNGETTQSRGHTPRRGDTGGLYEGGFGVIDRKEQHFNDVGGASRYFDLNAWAEHRGFFDVPKPSKAERDRGLTNFPLEIPKSKFNLSDGSKDMRFDGVIPRKRRNVHPTVKPVKLMAYLIELGCPKGGVVLDPFVGSGTTCIAAKKLRRKYIGIEINPEYAEMARARIDPRGPLDQFMEANGG